MTFLLYKFLFIEKSSIKRFFYNPITTLRNIFISGIYIFCSNFLGVQSH